MDVPPVFRASKRRKIASRTEKVSVGDASDDENASSLIKARSQIKSRTNGLQFSNTRNVAHDGEEEFASALVPVTDGSAAQAPSGLHSRFVGSGGGSQVVNVDKHMVDYIDQAIAERQHIRPAIRSTAGDKDVDYADASSDEDETVLEDTKQDSKDTSTSKARQNPTQHLSEVDLGPQATVSNLARTTAALSGQPTQEEAPKRPQRKKPRLGRDGKPLKPRPRKGPNPDDVARNRLVEQVLHEHGLGTYDSARTTSSKSDSSRGHDEAADERMAVEFQQQFLDAMAERQQRQTQQSKNAGVSAAAGSGPRLGGSRSARAKMAEMQAQASVKEKDK